MLSEVGFPGGSPEQATFAEIEAFGHQLGRLVAQTLDQAMVHGTVTCNGQVVETGGARFVPIEVTKGPASHGVIVNGKYRIDIRGGVPIGKHRVEVDARRKTGKKVPTIMEQSILIEQTVPVGLEAYAGRESPLVMEVTADSDGEMDIEIPAR